LGQNLGQKTGVNLQTDPFFMRFFTLNYGHKFGHNFALKIEVLLVLKKVLLTVEMPGFRTIL